MNEINFCSLTVPVKYFRTCLNLFEKHRFNPARSDYSTKNSNVQKIIFNQSQPNSYKLGGEPHPPPHLPSSEFKAAPRHRERVERSDNWLSFTSIITGVGNAKGSFPSSSFPLLHNANSVFFEL